MITIVAAVAGFVAQQSQQSAAATTSSAPVMIVLDASGSMNTTDAPGSRISAARRAVVSLIHELPSTARVGMLTYGTGTDSSAAAKAAGCRDVRLLAPVQRVDKQPLIAAVNAVRARGYTPIGRALRTAAAALPATGAATIVLVSDGEDTCAPPAPCAVARQLKAANRELIVHTIGFRVGDAARSQLGCIAHATGGTYRDANDGAALGPVLDSQVDAGLRPYVVQGRPIDGTSTPEGAPLVAAGQYADHVGASSGAVTKNYSIRLDAGRTVTVTATIVPPALRGGGTARRLEVSARLLDAHGHRCVSTEREHDSVLSGKVDPVSVVLSAEVGGAQWSKRCSTSGTFVVAVTRESPSTLSTDMELLVRVDDPVENVPAPSTVVPSGLAAPVAHPGTHRRCTGGASFDTAPRLDAGTCTDTLSTGETRYYRVPVAFGQRFAYRIVVDRVPGAARDTAFVQSAVATPVRADVTLASTSNASRDFGGPTPIALTGATLVPAGYGNRNSARSDIRAYDVAGDYYLSLGMTYPVTAVPYTTTVSVTVAVAGKAQPAPRTISSASTSPTSTTSEPSVSGSTTTDASSGLSASAPSVSPSGTPVADPPSQDKGLSAAAVALIVAAAVVVLGTVAAVALRARRRSGARR